MPSRRVVIHADLETALARQSQTMEALRKTVQRNAVVIVDKIHSAYNALSISTKTAHVLVRT